MEFVGSGLDQLRFAFIDSHESARFADRSQDREALGEEVAVGWAAAGEAVAAAISAPDKATPSSARLEGLRMNVSVREGRTKGYRCVWITMIHLPMLSPPPRSPRPRVG